MVRTVHHQLYSPARLTCKGNGLKGQMGDQLLAAVGTAGMACDHPHRHPRNGCFRVKLLKMGCAAVIIKGYRAGTGPLRDHTR